MRYEESERERSIKSLMRKGLAPSQIDKRLKLDKGEAHDTVIRLWRLDAWR